MTCVNCKNSSLLNEDKKEDFYNIKILTLTMRRYKKGLEHKVGIIQ